MSDATLILNQMEHVRHLYEESDNAIDILLAFQSMHDMTTFNRSDPEWERYWELLKVFRLARNRAEHQMRALMEMYCTGNMDGMEEAE